MRNYGMMAVFLAALAVLEDCMQSVGSQWAELLVNGCISVGISVVVCGGVLLFNKELLKTLKRSIKRG